MKTLRIFSCLLLIGSVACTQDNQLIRTNQLGYYPLAPKLAIVTGPIQETEFYISSEAGTDTLFKGSLGEELHSKNSSMQTHVADFTNFRTPGKYVLHVGAERKSYPFLIGADVLKKVAISSIKGFYFQRASMPLLEKHAGKWARPSGHPDDKVIVHPSAASSGRTAGTVINSPGGWYDAGDYNKYIVNSGITMGTLLSAFEDFPAYYKTINTNIPESNDAVPDLLNEILYNLRWMLTMQDPFDGGVYNKCTEASFSGMLMPDKVNAERYVVQKGTAATLDFVAVTAQAARIFANYKKQFPGLSDSCLNAAKYAWEWVQKNPAIEYNQSAMNKMMYKPAINTGGYGDKNFTDEWFWAACELYVSTMNEDYYKFIARSVNNKLMPSNWGNVFALGYYTLLRNESKIAALHAKDVDNIKRYIKDSADAYLAAIPRNAFQTVMGHAPADFVWGSNSNAANQAILLLNAYYINKDRKYADAALSNMDYLLGRNATGYCFVTGIGSHSPLHIHHRISVADGVAEPVPGLLAGGPNPGKQDKCDYPVSDPETTYLDSECSYASNEVAINWNAPLVYVSNALQALQYELAYSTTITVQKKK
jgi:endoglucanase